MCIFCDIIHKKQDALIVSETKQTLVFLDYDPINEGHMLIVPKEHKMDIEELTDDVLLELMNIAKHAVQVLKQIYPMDGYTIMQNGGEFNEVGHFHLHVFPRYKEDGFGWTDTAGTANVNKEVAANIRRLM